MGYFNYVPNVSGQHHFQSDSSTAVAAPARFVYELLKVWEFSWERSDWRDL